MKTQFKVKITEEDITFGPTQIADRLHAMVVATDLMQQGYRKVSNAYCRVARIDRDDWLDVLAQERRCSRADFYNVNGSGIGNQHRDHYVRVFSKDVLTVHPMVMREMNAWF